MIHQVIKRLLVPVCALAILSGCVTKPESLYHWGDFQTHQYNYFKGEKGPEDGIQHLERIRDEAKSTGKSVPPGLQAHLGMLYGQTGHADKFEQHLLAERQQFPEATSFLDFLLKNKQKPKTTP